MYETPELHIGQIIAQECRYNAEHNRKNLFIRVARADDGSIYATTTDKREYLDDTIVYLHPIIGISQWQEFIRNHKNWRSK